MPKTLRAIACGVILLAGLHAAAQQVTLSGRVKLASIGKPAHSPQAGGVVVWLRPLDPQQHLKPFPAEPLKLVQRDKTFEPHLLVVPVGAVVQFPNRDPFFHNVFSLFEGKRFDLGLYEAGSTRNVSFDRPGISYIFCNIHAEMSAVVIALDTPYYSISTAKGEVVIPDVPVGRYEMHIWYETALPETLKALTRELNVSESTSTLGLLEIPAGGTASGHRNKYGMDYEPSTPNAPGYNNP